MKGVKFYHKQLTVICKNVVIGEGTVVHPFCFIGQGVRIGRNCRIQAYAFIPTGVTISDNVFIGPHVCFINDRHPPSHGEHWEETHVCGGAVIGANATILPGRWIGHNAIVGAGAVVTKDIPDGATVVGNPARLHDISDLWIEQFRNATEENRALIGKLTKDLLDGAERAIFPPDKSTP